MSFDADAFRAARLEKTFAELLAQIRTATSKRVLDLASENLNEDDIRRLSKALIAQSKKDKSVLRLDLRKNFVQDKGCEFLAVALKVHQTLWFLDLSNNFIKSGVEHIAKVLPQSKLSYLLLCSNEIDDRGAIALHVAIKATKTLVELDLRGNCIGDKGAFHIAEAIKSNTSLTTLNLSQNSFSEAGALALLEGMRINLTLTDLKLRGYSRQGQTGTKRDASGVFKAYDRNYVEDMKKKKKKLSIPVKIEKLLQSNMKQRKEAILDVMLKDNYVKLNIAKLMVLGPQRSGKSAFCSALMDQTYLDQIPFKANKTSLVARYLARSSCEADSVSGNPWTPGDIRELFKDVSVHIALKNLHQAQLLKQRRETDDFCSRKASMLSEDFNLGSTESPPVYIPEYDFIFDSISQELIRNKTDPVVEEKKSSETEAQKYGMSEEIYQRIHRVAEGLTDSDFVDWSLNLDAITFAMYDFHFASKLHDFKEFANMYLTKNGVNVICVDMRDFVPNMETIEMRPASSLTLSPRLRSVKSSGSNSNDLHSDHFERRKTFETTKSFDSFMSYSSLSIMKDFYRDELDEFNDPSLLADLESIKSDVESVQESKSSSMIQSIKKKIFSWTTDKKKARSRSSSQTMTEPQRKSRSFNIPTIDSEPEPYVRKGSDHLNEKLEELRRLLNLCVSHAPHSPIIVVGTKLDQAQKMDANCVNGVNFHLQDLLKHYPQIVLNKANDPAFDKDSQEFLYYFPVSNKNHAGMRVVRAKIESVTRKMSFFNMETRLRHLLVLDILLNKDRRPRKRGGVTFSYTRALKTAEDLDICKPDEVREFLKFFHECGLIFFRPDDEVLKNLILPLDFDVTGILPRILNIANERYGGSSKLTLVPSRSKFQEKFMKKEKLEQLGLSSHLRLLVKKSLLSRPLFDIMFSGRYEKFQNYFLALLMDANCFVKFPKSPKSHVQDEVYLIPAFLKDTVLKLFSTKYLPRRLMSTVSPATEYTLFVCVFDFEASFLPFGMFHKVLADIISQNKSGGHQSNIIYKHYARIFLDYTSIAIEEGEDCKFGVVFKCDQDSVYMIVSDFMLEQKAPFSAKAVMNRSALLAQVAIKMRALLSAIFGNLKRNLQPRKLLNWRQRFCVEKRRMDDKPLPLRFMFQEEAQRQELFPWFDKAISENIPIQPESVLDLDALIDI